MMKVCMWCDGYDDGNGDGDGVVTVMVT